MARWHTSGVKVPLDVTNVCDDDVNTVEAVYHGPSKRSAPSVEIEPA